MALFETVLVSDLKKPVQVKELTGNLFSADNNGNKITVSVMDNGAAAQITGNVTGYVIRADGKTVVVEGELVGNMASIILPASAYAVIGRVSIVVKVGATTVGACTSNVYRSTTDEIVDPGTVIPSITALMEQIAAAVEEVEEVVESIPPDYTELVEEVNNKVDMNHATQYTPSNSASFEYGTWYHEVGTSYIARLNDSHAPADPELVSVWQVMGDAPYHIPSSSDYNWLVYTFADAMEHINDFQNNIADIFYSGVVYEEGHYVTRDGVNYKRKSWGSTTPVAKAWSASDWEKVEVANDLNEKIESECSDLKSAIGFNGLAWEVGELYITANGEFAKSTNPAIIIVFPIKAGHRYLFNCSGGNRWRICTGNVRDVYNGAVANHVIASSNTFDWVCEIDNSTNNDAYAYCYVYNGTSTPNIQYDVVDINSLDECKSYIFSGIRQNTSSGVMTLDHNAKMIVLPLVKNTKYRISINGGNRRNYALSTKFFTDVGDTVVNIRKFSSSDPDTFNFDSGTYNFLYIYYLYNDGTTIEEITYDISTITENSGLQAVFKYTDTPSYSQGDNIGIPFTVGEYNVAKYNNDSNVYISSEKLHNLKCTISEMNADVLIIDEDLGYIDANDTKPSLNYVFMPIYPYRVGSTREKIYSKTPFLQYENKTSPNDRAVTFATINVNNKVALIVCVHAKPGITADDVSARSEDLTWLLQEVSEVTCDYVIIGGDFNPETGNTDLANMETAFSGANMIMCNGGRCDYLNTWFDPDRNANYNVGMSMPLDYIITSNNIICNSFKVMLDKYYDLYSDHAPIIAKLTLLDN